MEISLDRVAEIMNSMKPYMKYLLLPIGVYAASRFLSRNVGLQKLKLEGRTVLITGASSGLGLELAKVFYLKGARVILTARSIDRLKEICEELKAMNIKNPYDPTFKYLDLADPNGFEEILSLSPNGQIDVLVHNAGIGMRGTCKETSLVVHRQLMEVNYFGCITVTRALLDRIPDDGAIIVVNSIQGRIAVPNRCAYSASKHAIQAFFDSLRCEDRPGLQILTANIGYMNTGMSKRALNVRGDATGRLDENQMKGMNPDFVAEEIVKALVNRKIELILAPFIHRLAIFLRWLAPKQFFHAMHKRYKADTELKMR